MVQIHTICVPYMVKVNGVGGCPTTYIVSLPRVLQEVKCSVLGCLSVAHSVQSTLQSYHVLPILIQDGRGPRRGGTAVPLWLVWNSYASGEDHHTPEDGELKQKHPNEVTEKVCSKCVQVLGGYIQPNRRGTKRQNASREKRCLNKSGWCWTSRTTTVQNYYITSGSCVRCGRGMGSWYRGRGRIHLSRKRFITHYFSWCCCLEQRCGCYWRHVNTNSFTSRSSILATFYYIRDV